LLKIGFSISKKSSNNYLKYEIAGEVTNRTFTFANTIVLGIFINELTAQANPQTLYLYLAVLALTQLTGDLLVDFLYSKVNYYRRFTDQAVFQIILEKYQNIPIPNRNEPKFAEIERNIDVNSVANFISSFINLMGTIYKIFLAFLALTFIDFSLFFIAILAGLISLYFNSVNQIRIMDNRDEIRYNKTLLSDFHSNFNYQNVNSMSDNLIMNKNFSYLKEKYSKQLKDFYAYNFSYYQKVDKLRDYSYYLLDIAGAVTLVLVYLQGINGQIPVGTLVILIASYGSFTGGLNSLGNHSARILREFLEVKSANDLIEYKIDDQRYEPLIEKKKFKIEFKNVSFKYPETDKLILKNINLTIEKGDKLGIIGQNGAGKSTLIKLIFRLYQPTEGEILLNGQNIFNIRDEDYYSIIKILAQEQSLESTLPIKEIIHLGNSEKKFDLKKIKWAAKMSGADEFIKNFEDGYDQLIAKQILHLNKYSDKKYVTPSPGQRRRLQIARLFYSEKPIIILDEPTSNIDPLTSKEVFENLNKLKNNQILILIAHDVLRLNNTANKIAILKEGELIEYGNREELLKNENSEYFKTISSYNSKDILVEKN